MKTKLVYVMLVFSVVMITLGSHSSVVQGSVAQPGYPSRNYAATVKKVSASQATYAQEGFPNTHTGSSQRNMYVGKDHWFNKKRTRIYVKFNLPDLGGATITSAKVQLGQYAAEASSSYRVKAYRVTSNWSESSLTWNHQPGRAETVGSATFSTHDGTKEIDITDLVRQWYDGTRSNYGITIRMKKENDRGGVFCSRSGTSSQCQGQIHPRLRIEYQEATPDTTSPDGQITLPNDGSTVKPGSLKIKADAWDNSGGSGVKQVEFYIMYDGAWHLVATDVGSPYEATWNTPGNLHSQKLKLAIHVTDNAENTAIDPGGVRTVNFIESQGGGVKENWVPARRRAYLNQRSLGPHGGSKCGAASAAMMLAMNGLIGRSYNSLRNTANAIYPKTIKNGRIWVYRITSEMRARGLNAREKYKSAKQGWKTIKSEIDAGRPVTLLSRKTTKGHFFVVVGYREKGSSRKIIVYDPYGRWRGSFGRYNRNSKSPNSTKGRWVFYDYNAAWGGGWLITGRPYVRTSDTSDMSAPGEPDPISDEPLDEVTYEGVLVDSTQFIFLPLVIRGGK